MARNLGDCWQEATGQPAFPDGEPVPRPRRVRQRHGDAPSRRVVPRMGSQADVAEARASQAGLDARGCTSAGARWNRRVRERNGRTQLLARKELRGLKSHSGQKWPPRRGSKQPNVAIALAWCCVIFIFYFFFNCTGMAEPERPKRLFGGMRAVSLSPSRSPPMPGSASPRAAPRRPRRHRHSLRSAMGHIPAASKVQIPLSPLSLPPSRRRAAGSPQSGSEGATLSR